MKDSANGCLASTYVTTTSGIQYCFRIYPNGNRDENRGKVFVFLIIRMGNFKEIDVKCAIGFVHNPGRRMDHIFKESGGWGKCFCDTIELFDAPKGFIRDGKLELRVAGAFEFEDGKTLNIFPTKLGDELLANEESKDLQIFVDGKVIKVHKLILATVSSVFNKMLTSKSKEIIENQLTISDFSFHIVESALLEIYGSTFSMTNTDSLIQFYDKFDMPSFKDLHTYFLLLFTGNSAPQPDGISVTENNDQTIINYSVGNKLWENEESKDYTIIIGGKTIKVHKFILAAKSPTFASMLRTKPAKNQLEICDFSFNVVEMAMHMIYQYRDNKTITDASMIFQFLCKYEFPSVKDYLEAVLISIISTGNVCLLTNCAIITKSMKLHGKCMEFLMAAFASNTPLNDVCNLDKNVALQIVQNSGYRIVDKDAALKILFESSFQIVYTRKENASSSIMPK